MRSISLPKWLLWGVLTFIEENDELLSAEIFDQDDYCGMPKDRMMQWFTVAVEEALESEPSQDGKVTVVLSHADNANVEAAMCVFVTVMSEMSECVAVESCRISMMTAE